MKGPLPYDTVGKVNFDKVETPLFNHELRQRSTARVASDPEFGYIIEDLTRVKKRLAENKLSLNIEKRRAEIEEEKARKEKRTAERAARPPREEKRYAVTLETLNKPDLELVTVDKKNPRGTPATTELARDPEDDAAEQDEEDANNTRVDAIRNEAVNIVADLADLSRAVKSPATASTVVPK